MNILEPTASPRTQRQSKATLIAQESDLREKYHDCLSRLSDYASRRSDLEDKLTTLLDTIEGEEVVTAQFIKECRFLLAAK